METETEEALTNDTQLVAASLPEIPGLLRRITRLWDGRDVSYFRVNFHDPEHANYIVKSAFVAVRAGKAEVWE
jgi:hypothetical protein